MFIILVLFEKLFTVIIFYQANLFDVIDFY